MAYFKLYITNTYGQNGVGMASFWSEEFIKSDFSNFLTLLVENLKYFFSPAKMILFALILIIWGLIVLIKEKRYSFVRIFSYPDNYIEKYC